YIEKRGERSWRLNVDIGYDANGKRLIKRKTIRINDKALLRTTKKLADYLEMELAKFKMDVEAGTYVAPGKTKFSDFIDTWMERHVKLDLTEKTRLNYKHHITKRIKPWFGHMRIDQIKALHIRDFLDHMRTTKSESTGKPVSDSTIIYTYRVLRSIFRSAMEWQVIKENPMATIKKPKDGTNQEMKFYDEHDLEKLFQALAIEPLQIQSIVMLAVMGGLRRAEIAGLEWKHIDSDNKVLTVEQSIPMYMDGKPLIKSPKTQKSVRRMAIPNTLLETLEEYKKEWLDLRDKIPHTYPAEILFCHECGTPYDPQRITERWGVVGGRCNRKNSVLDDLRHTAAMWMIAKGVNGRVVASLLEPAISKTTMEVYVQIIENAGQIAASVFDEMPMGKREYKKALA